MEGVTSELEQQAHRMLKEAAGRVTRTRLRVLIVLLSSDGALNHADVQEQVPDIDRVSLYRILDWLTEKKIAFRITDTDGHRRYGIDGHGDDHHHAHFHCLDCGTTTCLPEVPNPAVKLPPGYQGTSTKVLISGQCPACQEAPDLHPTTVAIINIIKSIPTGSAMSYGTVATKAGLKGGARQVSRILHSSAKKHDLPWHRVVNAKGQISLTGEGAEVQRHLLAKEGVAFTASGAVAQKNFLG